MKNLILKSNFFSILAATLLLGSCSVEDGQDGADGIDGVDGADGADGSTNIVISEWFPSGFSEVPTTFDLMAIENEIFNEETASNAVILVYGRRIDGVFGLPVIFDEESYFFFVRPEEGRLYIVGQNIESNTSIYNSFNEYRYIIIPGTSTSKKNQPDFYKMSYEAVINYFKLKA